MLAQNVSNCHLRKLPEQICYCTSLITLNLSNNRLRSLPVSIGRMTRLTVLDCSYNEITDLPLSIGLWCAVRRRLRGARSIIACDSVGFESVGARLLLDGNPLANLSLQEKLEIGTDHAFRFLVRRAARARERVRRNGQTAPPRQIAWTPRASKEQICSR